MKDWLIVVYGSYPRVYVDVFYNLSIDEEKWILSPRAVNCLDVEQNC